MNSTQLRYRLDIREEQAPWPLELEALLRGIVGIDAVRVDSGAAAQESTLVFTDRMDLEPSPQTAIILVIREGQAPPVPFLEGRVDAALSFPFRKPEFLSVVRGCHQALGWAKVQELSERLSVVAGALEGDLDLAERLQKALLPQRFPDPKGFKVYTRYVAGLRPGGDYFDLVEARASGNFSLLMTDSSSYSLSGSVLAVLMRAAVKLAGEDVKSVRETVQRLRDEMFLLIGERESLSLFYGQFSGTGKSLRYFSLGNTRLFRARKGEEFEALPSQGEALRRQMGYLVGEPYAVDLRSEDRLLLVSDGFLGESDGLDAFLSRINAVRMFDGQSFLNELSFSVKGGLEDMDDLPPQDSSAVLLDVEAFTLRLQE